MHISIAHPADTAGSALPREVTEQATETGSGLVAVVLAAAVAITVTLAAYVYAGAPYAVMAVITWCIALGGWLRTSFRHRSHTPVAFTLYIATLVALTALYAEEWYRRFPSTLMRLFPNAYPPGVGIGEHAFVAVFPLAASACMTLGALAYYRRTPIGDFAAWAVFAWGCVAAVSVYLVAPIAGRAETYVGGMIMAPVVLVVALAGATRLVRRGAEVDA